MQPIRKAIRLLYRFPSFWRCVYLPQGVIQWIHPPTPLTAPGQGPCPTSPSDHQGRRERRWRSSSNSNPLAMEIPHKLHSFPLLGFCSSVTDRHCRLRQSSSGSLSSGKERKGREEKGMGEGRVLALLRCLWKMNHGGLHRGRSKRETHLVRKKREKNRIEKRAENTFPGVIKSSIVFVWNVSWLWESQVTSNFTRWHYDYNEKDREIKTKRAAHICVCVWSAIFEFNAMLF